MLLKKNNIIHLIEGLFLIIFILVAAILSVFSGLIPVKNIYIFNISIYIPAAGAIITSFIGILFLYYMNRFRNLFLVAGQEFEFFFRNLPLPSFIVDIESGRFIDANANAIKFYGYPKDELLNMDISRINISNSPQELRIFRRAMTGKGGGIAIFKHKIKHGEIKIVQSHIAVITLNGKQSLLVIILDITEKVANEKWMNILYTGIENSPDWIMVTDSLGNIEYVNKGVENISGYNKEELIGKNPRIFKSGLLGAEFYKTLWDTINTGETLKGVLIDRRKNGELFTLDATLVPIKGKEDFNVINFVSIAKDVTQEKTLEEKVKYISFYDPLTKLANKNLFTSTINTYLGRREYKEEGFNASVVIVDVYKLSYFNSTYGYDAGDKLLQSFSERLSKVMRSGDMVSRVGGDEFGIFFTELKGKEAILPILERIKEEFKKPLNMDEIGPLDDSPNNMSFFGEAKPRSFNPSFTIGISIFPDDGKNADDLLKSADIALSNAKAQGEGEYKFFKKSMNVKASEFLVMKHNIVNALKDEEFLICYQPYFDIKTGRMKGMEALARWNSKNIGMIPPAKFIHILEEMKLIQQFEEFMIDKVCKNLKEWEEKGLSVAPVSMNISPVSFGKEGLIDMTFSASDRYKISPSMINIEITEGLFIQNLRYAVKILNIFKEKGIKILLDDFGAGYSSLSYIKNIPADFIKIDISFIKGMVKSPKDLAIVSTIVVFASKLGMKTIGEGVETKEQLEILESLGCDMAQGYLFSKPVPENELFQFLKQP